MDVLQKKVAPVGAGKKWVARTASVALLGALVLPAVIESNGALAATKPAPVKKEAAKKAPAKKAPAKKAPAKKAPAKKAPAKKAPAKKAPAKKASIRKVSVKKEPITVAPLGAEGPAVAAGTTAGIAVSKKIADKNPVETKVVAKKNTKSTPTKPMKKLRMRRLHLKP